MSDKELLDNLGSELINTVRDRSIKRLDNILSGDVKAKDLINLHDSLVSFDLNQIKIIRNIVMESIDNVIFNTLNMLEQNEENMRLLISQDGDNEKNVVEISDGLSGELFTENGWIEKFSKYK